MDNKIFKIVRKIIIGFFVLVFVMGFFSKSVVNFFLPKVQVVESTSEPIRRTIDIEGEITARYSIKVQLKGEVIVEDYYKKPGDKVKVGDALFKINSFYSAQLHSNVDAEGIYKSDTDGIVLSINKLETRLAIGTIIMEITQDSKPQQMIYTGKIPEKYNQIIRDASEIEIETSGSPLIKPLKINYISKADENGMIDIQCIFPTDKNDGIEYGQKLSARIIKTFSQTNNDVIPLSAIIPVDTLSEGKSCIVYILTQRMGILGTEYHSQKVEITLLAIGDNMVAVKGLEAIQNPFVITNPSYKIQDGTKVFKWE